MYNSAPLKRHFNYINMNQFLKAILLAFFTIPLTTFLQAQQAVQFGQDPVIESKIDSLLTMMTLEEKIGQLTLYTSDIDITGPTIREGYKEDIRKGNVGSIFNAFGANYTRSLQKMAVEETRLKIPLLFGYDVIHGHKTIFPMPLGEAASWDLEAIQKSAQIAAAEASAEGLHWTFAPMVDIARDPRWGRITEGAGEDTYLGTKIAVARIKGFQGESLYDLNTIMACAKHFAAYGAALAGRDYNTVDMSDRVLREVYFPPFKAAVEAGVATFMTSFNEVDGVPATGSKYLMTDVLKEEWGFDGFVVTDYTSINEMIPHGVVANEKEAAELAIKAGVDMDMQGGVYQDHLGELVRSGQVSESQINESVRRILRMKYLLGLFEDPYRYSDIEREKEVVMSKEHLAAARDVSRKSIVLLKNEGNILPLRKSAGTIAVIGPLADSKREMIGSWSAAGDYTKAVTLLEGIKAAVPSSTKVFYSKGANINDDTVEWISEAVKVAQKSDVVILALGEAAQMSGEAASRSSIELPGVQLELAKALEKTGKPIVVVLMNGRPLAINWLDENIPSILETWFLGTQAGHAIADVIFGSYNPSGKLPVTFPQSVGQVPIFYNNKNTGRPRSDEKYTSKYLDISNEPLYPFGYGLSYTTFTYSNLTVDKPAYKMDDTVAITVTVANTGKVPGEEVVQLYVRDLVGSVTRPVKELKGFKKIKLEPGKSQQVKFTLTKEDLAFYTRNMDFKAEPGDFKVFAGSNSRDVLETEFKLVE